MRPNDLKTGLLTVVMMVLVVGTMLSILPGSSQSVVDIDNQSSNRTGDINVEGLLGTVPVHFVKNQGHLHEDVAYYVEAVDKVLYFTPYGITYALTGDVSSHDTQQQWVVKQDFLDAAVVPEAEDKREAVVSYFNGEQSDWVTGLPTYGALIYRDLWPGIDLVYRGLSNQLKYEFVIRLGADPSQIRLTYRGATNVQLTKTGAMTVTTPIGGFTDAAPYAYQEYHGTRTDVSANFILGDDRTEDTVEYGFTIGVYDPTQPLILDPGITITQKTSALSTGMARKYGDALATCNKIIDGVK